MHLTRCIKPSYFGLVKYELPLLSDASLQCYGRCCYVRIAISQGKVHCWFIIRKARVALIQLISISRLELTAAVVSLQLEQHVRC